MRSVAIPQEESCPVPDALLGDLYRASPLGLHVLVESIPVEVRAMLAVFCCRRSHLASLGLAVASTCERDDLIKFGGELGALVFVQSRQVPPVISDKRRKVTLSPLSADRNTLSGATMVTPASLPEEHGK
jgi:hypothetical protein